MQKILNTAKRFMESGVSVHWCEGKRPKKKGWRKRSNLSVEGFIAEYVDGDNLAVLAGEPSEVSPGYSLVIVDVDVHGGSHYLDDAKEQLRELVGDRKPTVITGGGGEHYYYRVPNGVIPDKACFSLAKSAEVAENGKDCWHIELLYTGKSVIAPPSIHPETSAPYRWREVPGETLPDLPTAIVQKVLAWPEPEPICTELEPVPSMEQEHIPGPLRDWLNDTAERMGCNPEFLLMGALSAIGSVIGTGCGIRPKQKDDWLVLPNLWCMIISEPSTKKSPALNAAQGPIRCLENQAQKDFEEEQLQFGFESDLENARRDEFKKRIKAHVRKTHSTSDAIAELEGDYRSIESCNEPTLVRYRTNDSTVEKLGELLAENSRGILVVRDELMGLLDSWKRLERQTDRQFYLEAWNGNGPRFAVDRIGRGTTFIDNLCVSILGATQKDKLLRYLHGAEYGKENDGLIQRFQLLVYPDQAQQYKYVDKVPNKKAEARVDRIVERLSKLSAMELGCDVDLKSNESPFLHFSREAQEMFVSWITHLNNTKIRNEENALVMQHLTKYQKLVPALALIFHLINVADGEAPGPVSLKAIDWAINLSEFLEKHARRVYRLLCTPEELAIRVIAQKILERKIKRQFTARTIYQRQWSGLDTETVKRACVGLEELGWIRQVKQEVQVKRGRPTMPCYEINPRVFDLDKVGPTKPTKRI